MTLTPAEQLVAAQTYAAQSSTIRNALGGSALVLFDEIDDYRDGLDDFVDGVVPLSIAAQRALVGSLVGYVRTVTGQDLSAALDLVTGNAIRDGDIRHSWAIIFFSLWALLGSGAGFDNAIAFARRDVLRTSNMDLALAQAAAMHSLLIHAWRRVLMPDACPLCVEDSGRTYYSREPMALHVGCRCAVAVITREADPGRRMNDEILSRLAEEQAS